MTAAIRAPLVVVSDIHIRAPNDANERYLRELIEQLDPSSVEHFVLLGDIFDFYFAAQRYFHRKFQSLFQALGRLSEAGVRITFVEGNHEFALARSPWKWANIITAPTTTIDLSSGERFLLTHGDLIGADFSYRVFRKLIKSEIFLGMARFIPGFMLNAYSLKHAEVSRSIDRPIDHQRILQAAQKLLDLSTDCQHCIFGHFHVPYAEPCPPTKNPRLLMSLPAWDQPNALVWDGKEFLRYFRRGEKLWQADRVRSFIDNPASPESSNPD